MAVFRIDKNKGYTCMSNYHFRDKRLSWKAKGILSNMLSLPDNWDYSLAGLTTLASDGQTATRTALKELEDNGYLIRKPIRKDGKIADWEYLIYEYPQTENLVVENQQVENQTVQNQVVENQRQYNTNKSTTNQSTTKVSNTNILKDIVEYLNSKAKTNYRASSKETAKHINARLTEGFTVDDFKTVIDKKCTEWLGTEFAQYLRPATLFGTKFESYLNAPLRAKAPAKTYGANGIAIEDKPSELDGIL